MLRLYYVYFKYKQPGDKKPGPVRHFRLYAQSIDDARKLATQQGNYPNLEILEIRPA
ncbi:MAG: hypothetical protein ACYTHJ_01025 [Planctomycetota bacterium]